MQKTMISNLNSVVLSINKYTHQRESESAVDTIFKNMYYHGLTLSHPNPGNQIRNKLRVLQGRGVRGG